MEHNKDIEENKDLAAFSYLWIMSVVVYLSKRKSPFVAFHAKQAMVLFALSIPVWFIPRIGQYLEMFILGFSVMGFISAVQGEWKVLPIIGSFIVSPRKKKHEEAVSGERLAASNQQSPNPNNNDDPFA
jgi:uncharacterized membrane protein